MAKFTLSLLALLLVVASAAAAAEILNHPSGGCRHKIQLQRLSSCRQYLRDGSRFHAPPRYEGGGWREAFPRCCDELEKINKQCRCEAVKQVVREQQQVGEVEGEEMREMLQTAENLPKLCRISPHEYCENIGQSEMF